MARDWNEIITGGVSDSILPGSTLLKSKLRPKAPKGVSFGNLTKTYRDALSNAFLPFSSFKFGSSGDSNKYPTPKTNPKGPGLTMQGVDTVDSIMKAIEDRLGPRPDQSPDVVQPFDLASIFAGLGGGSGGGESASERTARLKAEQATRTASGLMDMIASGGYKQPYTDMRSTLAKFLEGATKDIGSAYGGARTAVGEQYAVNPYEGLTGTATVADPALEGLLASQGASTDPLAQMVAANREAAQQRANAFTDVNRQLGTGFTERGKQARADIGSMETQSLLDLLSQGGAYGQQISSKEAAALKSLQDALAETAGQGADLQKLVRQRTEAAKPKPKPKPKGKGKGKK